MLCLYTFQFSAIMAPFELQNLEWFWYYWKYGLEIVCYRYFMLECTPCQNCLCLFRKFDVCQCPILCTFKWEVVEQLWMMDQEWRACERKQLQGLVFSCKDWGKFRKSSVILFSVRFSLNSWHSCREVCEIWLFWLCSYLHVFQVPECTHYEESILMSVQLNGWCCCCRRCQTSPCSSYCSTGTQTQCKVLFTSQLLWSTALPRHHHHCWGVLEQQFFIFVKKLFCIVKHGPRWGCWRRILHETASFPFNPCRGRWRYKNSSSHTQEGWKDACSTCSNVRWLCHHVPSTGKWCVIYTVPLDSSLFSPHCF